MKSAINNAEIERCVADVREGRLLTLVKLSRMLRCSRETARSIFAQGPGVLKFRGMYRVPETVVQRVLDRMMQGTEKLERSPHLSYSHEISTRWK